MKTLQNNFTTTEQSKKLLELGVPADSADCYFFDWTAKFKVCARNVLPENMTYKEMIMQPDSFNEVHRDRFLPCWSVGQLIEIFLICTPDHYDLFYPIISPLGKKFPGMEGYRKLLQDNRIINTIIEEIEERRQENTIDFSRLEE